MMQNKPSDREIYIKGIGKEKLVTLLNEKMGPLVFDSEIAEGWYLYFCDEIRILLNTQIQDGFISVYIKGNKKWRSDLELARSFISLPDVLIRCDPGIDYPKVSPYSNVFVEIDAKGERLIEWE